MAPKGKTVVTDFFMGPLRDFIPDEILNDGFKFATFCGLFMGMFYYLLGTIATTQTVTRTASNAYTGVNQWITTMISYVNPWYAAWREKVDAKMAATLTTATSDTTFWTAPDLPGLRARFGEESLQYKAISLCMDPVFMAAILAVSFASVGTYAIYETKLIENLPNLQLPDMPDIGVSPA